MGMRSSSLANNPLAVTRELDGRYDVVLQVRNNLGLIEQVAGVDFEAILAELEEAQDFTGISVIQGETVAWDAVNKILTVPKGDKGDTGAIGPVGPTGATGPIGVKGQQGDKGDTGAVGPTGPMGFTGAKGEKGDIGNDGQDLTIVQIASDTDGSFIWQFSDGTIYTTPSLIGPKGDTGSQGIKGDQGVGVHHTKGTSTTNPHGDFGTSPFKDTYTLYGDADETLNLGWFVVSNGEGMSAAIYDTNNNGVIDNSERLGGELPNYYVNTSADQQISGVKTFSDNVIVDNISYNGFGTTSWNADESTLDVVLPGATLQVGQEILIKVRAGTAITDGKVVMATGSAGNSGRIIVGLHDGTIANAKRVIGIATQSIASGADGLVTSYGKVRQINTTGLSVGETWVDGDLLYIKPNDAGSLTKVVPLDTEINMPVAFVVHAHTNGTLFVRISGVNENQVATSAKKLVTARNISLTGDVTGTVSFDGSANASITTTVAALALKVNNSEKGVANGISTLDNNGKIVLTQIPDSILGQLEYVGTWDFTTLPTATQKGQYWIASVSGNGYVVGDWAVWNGAAFDKVDNTDAVASVAGRTGNVTLTKTDVGLSNVDNTADSAKPISTAQQTALNLKANIASPVFTGNVTGLGVATGTSFNGITGLSSVAGTANGTAAAGTSTTTARADHVHPSDTTKITKVTSTDNSIVRYDGVSGDVQNSTVTISDAGVIAGGSLNGNASTATTLQTARSIGGVTFNGSADITLPGVNTTGNQNTTGSAATLTTARTIGMTGDVTWTSAGFNGLSNVTGTATLANSGVTTGTYKSVTVDSKGRVTGGTNPTTLSGYGITDSYTKTETNTQISTAVSGLVDAAPGTLDTLNELAAALGDDPNFATTVTNSIATKVIKNVDITAGSNTKITYDVKGLVTGGSTPTTLAGYSIANAYTKTEVDTALALKVDDTEIASVNLLRADKYLAAQNIANMVYTNGDLTKIQYKSTTDVDYEVLNYTSGNLTSINHYTSSVLRGTTTLSYSSGNLVLAIYA